MADPDGTILKLLGVNSGLTGRARRATFVIDKNGIVRRVYDSVAARGHADDVLAVVQAL